MYVEGDEGDGSRGDLVNGDKGNVDNNMEEEDGEDEEDEEKKDEEDGNAEGDRNGDKGEMGSYRLRIGQCLMERLNRAPSSFTSCRKIACGLLNDNT